MSAKAKILIVEHNQDDIELMQYELKKGGIDFISQIVQNEEDYKIALKNFIPDIILSDYSLPSFNGASAFKVRVRLVPETPFIFVSGTIGEESTIEYIKNGLTDYALKDKLFTLAAKVKRALKESEEKKHKDTTEQERIKSEARLKEAQAIALMGSWEIDIQSNKHIWSDGMCNIYGIDNKDEPSSELFLSFMHPEDATFAQEKVQEAFDTLTASSFNFRFIRRDGTPRYGYTEWRCEFDNDKKPLRLFGIVQDVTEGKLAETERERIAADLVQRNKDLEQFTYIVSHNLRSPVAQIMGTAEALRTMKLEKSEQEELIFDLSASIMKLNGVILDLNNILQTKRNVSEKREIISFSHLVKNIKISIGDQIKHEQVEIKTDFSEVDKMLTLKSYLYSVFYNLISNSIKYRRPNLSPVIEIKSCGCNDKIEIHFIDNGLGIDLGKKGDQVFGLYKRFHLHKEGKGMGLYMVKTQVETLGGKISIESEVNKGTKFIIQFPI